MAVSKLRNRVVLFRLTQEEYDEVQRACTEASARSISDFARARILGAPADGSSLAQIESRVEELSRSVQNLMRLLGHDSSPVEGVARPRADAAAAGHTASPFLVNSGD
jgi:hypothetical protein